MFPAAGGPQRGLAGLLRARLLLLVRIPRHSLALLVERVAYLGLDILFAEQITGAAVAGPASPFRVSEKTSNWREMPIRDEQ